MPNNEKNISVSVFIPSSVAYADFLFTSADQPFKR